MRPAAQTAAGTQPGPVPAALRAVSYTHLDVYKRQLLFPEAIFRIFTADPDVLVFSRSFLYVCMLILLFSALLGPLEGVVVGTGFAMLGFLGGLLDGIVLRICFSFFFGFALGMGAVGFFLGDALARLGPVSYTHLDVYKRQALIWLLTAILILLLTETFSGR